MLDKRSLLPLGWLVTVFSGAAIGAGMVLALTHNIHFIWLAVAGTYAACDIGARMQKKGQRAVAEWAARNPYSVL